MRRVITRLLGAGANPNTALPDGETVLMTAARTGEVDAVRVLLDRGADIRRKHPAKGQTALMWAAAENNAGVVKLLVERGADVKERSKSARSRRICSPFAAGTSSAATALLDAGVNVNETLPDGTRALVLAVINAHYELASVLLDRGANPERRRSGMDGAAPDCLVAPAQRRVQPARPGGDRWCRQPGRSFASWWRRAPTSTPDRRRSRATAIATC